MAFLPTFISTARSQRAIILAVIAALSACSGEDAASPSSAGAGTPDNIGVPAAPQAPKPALAKVLASPPAIAFPDDRVLSESNSGEHPGPASGWIVNSWGEPAPSAAIAVRNAGELADPAAPSVQSFVLYDAGGGDAQPMRQFTAQRGRSYTWRVYARAPGGAATATFGLRNDKPHYDYFGSRTVKLGSAWQLVEVTGRFPHKDGPASIRLVVAQPGAQIEFASAGVSASSRPVMGVNTWRGQVPQDFFGMTVNRLGHHNAWPGLSTRVVRMWDTGTRWMDLETGQDQWNFARADYYVDYASRNGSAVLLTLGQTPAWAAANPNEDCLYGAGCSPPANLADWRDYVRNVASHFGTKVKYWELWNEADFSGFWKGSPEQLAQMAEIAREEILRVNPQAQLVGPAVTPQGIDFLDRFLAAQGGTSLDALTFHVYMNSSLEDLTFAVENMRSLLKGHGLQTMPLWNSEFGVSCDAVLQNCTDPNERGQASQRVMASLFIMAAGGLRQADFYFWERGLPESPFSLLAGSSLEMSSEGREYDAASRLLGGAYVEESFQNECLLVVKFVKDGVRYVALWSEGREIEMAVPSAWAYRSYQALNGRVFPALNDGGVVLPASTLVIGRQ